MHSKLRGLPRNAVNRITKSFRSPEELNTFFEGRRLSNNLFEDYVDGEGWGVTMLWSFSYTQRYPQCELVSELGKGKKVPAAQVVDDYLSYYTMLGLCPFFAFLKEPELFNHPYMQGVMRYLVMDTLNYIATGDRGLSLSVLEQMAVEEAQDYLARPAKWKPMSLEVTPNYDAIKKLSFDEFFTLWLSRDNGWEDPIRAKDIITAIRT